MRIVFILNSDSLYGANRSLLGLIRFLVSRGCVCFAVIPSSGEIAEEFKKLKVEYEVVDYRSCVWYPGYIGLPFLVNLFRLPRLCHIIQKWDVDIIHTNSSTHDIGIIAAGILRKKHVWHVREVMELFYHAKYIFPKMYVKLRAKSDAVICVSKFVYNCSMERYPNKNMKMIYNPYDINYYDIKRISFAPEKKVRILAAGHVLPIKGQIDIVYAMAVLKERGIDFVSAMIVGGGDKEYIEKIERLIHEKNLEDFVEYRPYMSDLRELRKEHDIALSSSVEDALPRVTVEGMLGELLSIGTNSGGIAELIQEGETGLLYAPGNYVELADKIEYAVNHRSECWKMIRKAKEFAVREFELKQSGEKVLQVYRDILGK